MTDFSQCKPSDSTKVPSGKPVLCDDSSRNGSGATKVGSGAVKLPSDAVKVGSGLVKVSSGPAKLGLGPVKLGSGTMRKGSGPVKLGSGAIRNASAAVPDSPDAFRLPIGLSCGPSACCRVDPEALTTIPIWKLAVACIFAGQMMMFSLGFNNTPVADRPIPGTTTYWILHGALLSGALIVMALLGPPLFKTVWRQIKLRQVTLETLFVLSLGGALIGSVIASITGSSGLYYEVVPIVLVIYSLGQLAAVHSRRKAVALASQWRQLYETATIRTASGARQLVPLNGLDFATAQVLVAPGERITVDGLVLEGHGYVRESAITGEPGAIPKYPGSNVHAGSLSEDGEFVLRPTVPYGGRQLDLIFAAVGSAELRPSELQLQADRVMRWFVPLVASIACATFFGWYISGNSLWWEALFHAMAVLLVACPCALGLATPLAVWTGLHRLAELGLTAKTGTLIDKLSKTTAVVFDKTGTLSEDATSIGEFTVLSNFAPKRIRILSAAAALETGLSHPVAQGIARLAPEGETPVVLARQWHAGQGVEGRVRHADGLELAVRVGEWTFMPKDVQAAFTQQGQGHTQAPFATKRIYVAVDNHAAGAFLLEERIRSESVATSTALRAIGVSQYILSGDPSPQFADIAGVTIESGLSPAEKATRIKELQRNGAIVLYVGDGLNDTPAASQADAAIAVGGASALLQESAHGVLMGGNLAALVPALRLCRQIRRTIKSNLYFAAAYNGIGVALAALGLLHPAVAALLMALSSAWVSYRAWRTATALKVA